MNNCVEKKFVSRTELELENCTFVKTALMLLVVAGHSIVFWTGSWFSVAPIINSPSLSISYAFLNSFHIYAFTLVSGYIFEYLRYELGRYSSIPSFILGKVKRLLVPYTVLSILWAGPIAYHFHLISAQDFFARFVLAENPNQLWFLWMLFDVFIIFRLLDDFFKKYTGLGAFVLVCFYCIGVVGSTLFPNVFQVWTACQYISFFWVGFKIRQYGSQQLMKIPFYVWLLADISLFTLVNYISFDSFVLKILALGLKYLLHIIGAVMAFVLLQKLASKVHFEKSKVFNLFSKCAMPIYLFHQQIIYFTVAWLNGLINPHVHAVVNFTVALSVSLLISCILLKFKFTRHLLGEK